MARNIFLLVLLASTFINPAFTQSRVLTMASPEAGGFSAKRLALLDSGMNAWVKNNWVNGSVALIARKGKIIFFQSRGYNNLETKELLDKTGIFRIASQTKAITTVAALMLWEEGKFSFDDPVSKFIPAFDHQTVISTFRLEDTSYTTVPARRNITIRDILTQTSGISYPGIGSAEAKALYPKKGITGGVGANPTMTLAETMNQLGTTPLLFQPGDQWMYGVNTDLLGYLIEIWSGQTLEDFFTKRIFQPLGMKDTYFNVPAIKAKRLVNFFVQDSTGLTQKQDKAFGGAMDLSYPIQHKTYFSGGGGLSSTIYDYAIFLQMLLNNGVYGSTRLLSRNTVRLMTMNQIGDLYVTGTENKFSFGFSLITDKGSHLGPSQAGTYAWGGVFSTSYWVDPKEDMLVILYRQMWGPHIADIDKAFKPLVYQAIND